MTNWINLLPLGLIFTGCILFLVSGKRSVIFACLTGILLSEFILDFQFAALLSSLTRLVASLAALLAIFLSMKDTETDFGTIARNTGVFRATAYVFFVILSVLMSFEVSSYLQIPFEVSLGGLLALFCGILYLGISSSPSKIILGIMLFYGGFTTVFNVLESSIVLNGLLSIVLLLLGGLGSYFIVREVTVGEE